MLNSWMTFGFTLLWVAATYSIHDETRVFFFEKSVLMDFGFNQKCLKVKKFEKNMMLCILKRYSEKSEFAKIEYHLVQHRTSFWIWLLPSWWSFFGSFSLRVFSTSTHFTPSPFLASSIFFFSSSFSSGAFKIKQLNAGRSSHKQYGQPSLQHQQRCYLIDLDYLPPWLGHSLTPAPTPVILPPYFQSSEFNTTVHWPPCGTPTGYLYTNEQRRSERSLTFHISILRNWRGQACH